MVVHLLKWLGVVAQIYYQLFSVRVLCLSFAVQEATCVHAHDSIPSVLVF